MDPAALDGAAAVVHLAGRGLGDRPWTAAPQADGDGQPGQGTTTIAARHGSAEPRLRVLVSTSGHRLLRQPGRRGAHEDAARVDGYVARDRRRVGGRDRARLRRRRRGWSGCAPAWCSRRRAARSAGCCRCSGSGSAAGSAPGGSGGPGSRCARLRRAVRFLLDQDDIAGPVNISAPEPITNADMTAAMGRVLHRPTSSPSRPASR